MQTPQYTDYNKSSDFKNEIMPVLAEFKRLCKVNKIPFWISVATENEENKTKYYYDGLMPGSNNVKLYDDQFRKHLLVIQGAEVSVIRNKEDDIVDYIDSMVEDDE